MSIHSYALYVCGGACVCVCVFTSCLCNATMLITSTIASIVLVNFFYRVGNYMTLVDRFVIESFVVQSVVSPNKENVWCKPQTNDC